MLYGRPSYIYRRYPYPDMNHYTYGRKRPVTDKTWSEKEKAKEQADDVGDGSKIDASSSKSSIEIPLPNQEENVTHGEWKTPGRKIKYRGAYPFQYKPSFIDFIREHVHLEELLLIGLIILFLKEGIEDELLTILLIYILLA